MSEGTRFQGARLRIARLIHGWTKAELADRLAVSRQYIHALEIGSKQASEEFVAALCLVLKVTPAFFASQLPSEVREEECHFRSRSSMPAKVADQVVSIGTALELVVTHLDSKLTLPQVDFPVLEAKTPDDLELAAESCRVHWKLGVGPISNMTRVLENAGAVVMTFNGGRHEVDALSMARVRPIVVRNTLKQSPGRQRFDLAHECAHLIVHQGVQTGDKETETQANRFASAFLMPRKAFLGEFPARSARLDWKAVYALKLRWRVSARAVVHRAFDLDLIDVNQFAAANRFLNYSGQARVERYDDRIPSESPELLNTAIAAYLRAYQVSGADFCRTLGMTPALLEQLVPGALRGWMPGDRQAVQGRG
jgi:Zn-dependent peptidase ImmA (M78 family)/transcriptional regulator with XRE-family HTH domain